MATAPANIGGYAITRELGRGGMGVVYLGHDPRLDRDVAIKLLPEHLAQDPDRLARFEREARTLAQLSHPNIAGIHGLEEHEGRSYLVLEYVDGETLADRLQRGPLPLDEALEIAIQIASGVEAAHEAGVIHRDLKPGNVIVTPEGSAKVLDFGLARMDERSQSSGLATDSPTMTSPARHSPTVPGVILGTAAYMSPEQARGRTVDRRSDVWSFGVTLHEMLTGVGLFDGETVSDSIGAVLHKEVGLDHLPAETPLLVRHLLTVCLARDKRERFRDMGDVRIELQRAVAEGPTGMAAPAPPRGRGALTSPVGVIVTGVVALLLGAAAVALLGPSIVTPAPAPSISFEIPLDLEGRTIAVDDLAIAPDGSTIVVAPVDDGPFLVRELNAFGVRALENTQGGDWPFFSPDGRWIGFYQDGRLLRIALEGGLPLETGVELLKAIWLDEGTILQVTPGDRFIQRIDLDSGTTDMLIEIPVELGVLGFDSVCAVPGQRYVLASAYTGNSVDAYSVLKVSLDAGSAEVVMPNASSPMIASGDELVFLRDSSLYAIAFDAPSGTISGRERRVLDGVTASQWGGQANAALAQNGTLVYLPGDRLSKGRRVMRVTASGETEAITDADALEETTLAVAPDGSKLVFSTLRRSLESWILDVESGRMQRIVSEGESYSFRWDGEGRRIAYTNVLAERGYEATDVIVRDIESGERPRVIATHPDVSIHDWFPDGSALLIGQESISAAGETERKLLVLDLERPEEPRPLLDDVGKSVTEARFSPDGRWLAYISDETGQPEVHVRRLPALDRAWRVSFAPSTMLNWSPDSDALYWVERDSMMKASLQEDDGSVSVGGPVEQFRSPWPRAWTRWTAWKTAPGGTFITIAPAEWEQEPSAPRVITNLLRGGAGRTSESD